MLDRFDHRFKGNRYYNFFITFAGLFFAVFLILPDEWRRPAPLLLAAVIAAAIAKFASKFASSNTERRQDDHAA